MRTAVTTTRRAATLERLPELPRTMCAAAIDAFGGPGALSIYFLPVPMPDGCRACDEEMTRPAREFVSFSGLNSAMRWAEVPIAAAFGLANAARAHERLTPGHVLGNIVLRMRCGSRSIG